MQFRAVWLAPVAAFFALAACTSPQEKAAEAEAEYTEEKTKTLKEYKECAKDAEGDEQKLKSCDALLKAVEAVEGGGK